MNTKMARTWIGVLAIAVLVVPGMMQAQGPPFPGGGGPGLGIGPDDAIAIVGFEGGVGGKTVAGAPFSATFTTQTTQTLADGNQIQRSASGAFARDSQGRTRRDLTLPAIGAFVVVSGQSLSHVTFINDPVAGTRYLLEENRKIARQMPEPPDKIALATRSGTAVEPGADRNPDAQKEIVTTSLGTQTIGGISAEGTRYTRTIPAGEIGNAKPIVIVTERWYSPDLQMVVMTKRSDPRSGETTFQMTNIQRQEPAATLFQVPADYAVVQGPPHGGARLQIAGPPPPPEP
jgi:hypothetical protein